MKFNRTEMGLLACQPGHRFDKEGVMFIRERQEGFFRRNEKSKKLGSSLMCVGAAGRVCVERWCRLRGNLLFYFKSRDQWSEPAGVIVLENFTIQTETDPESSTYGLLLVWEAGQSQYLGCPTLQDREAWQAVLLSSSHHNIRKHVNNLQRRLDSLAAEAEKCGQHVTMISEIKLAVIDPSTPPVLESTFTCDNLLCDAIGRSPSTRLVVSARNSSLESWKLYANTEIVERTSNPMFMVTISFRSSDGVHENTQIRVCAQDTRERFSMVRTSLGEATTSIADLKQSERVRLRLESPNPEGRGAGFVTITSSFGDSQAGASTESTPAHTADTPSNEWRGVSEERSLGEGQGLHKRSLSLPPSIAFKKQVPEHPNLLLLHSNPAVRTYRFHSGLGGDISVQEMMAEPRFSFSFPQQLLSLWIAEEKELVHEIAGLGELKEPYHSNQMRWLENHLNLINIYSTNMEHIQAYKGPSLKKSSEKGDHNLEFIPTNLHLQRMWAENSSLRRAGFFDVHTVGAFTAFAQTTRSEGLIRMLKELKSPQKDSAAWCSLSDRLQMAEDSLAAIRRVRREVVDSMRFLMKLAKDKNPEGMFGMIECMLKKTKLLCSISDTQLVEEAASFLEKNRVSVRPEKDDFSDSVAEFMQRNRLKIDLHFRPSFGSLQTPNTEFISKELGTPDPDFFSPSLDPSKGEYWRGYSAFTSGYQSVDRLSDIDEFEESFRYMSIEDKTRHYYTLCRNATPGETPVVTPRDTPVHSRSEQPSRSEMLQPVQVANSETVFSENDSALEDDDDKTDNSHQLSEDEADINDYNFDEDVYHNDDELEAVEGVQEDEQGDDDESTPHVGSETSKTQSPSSLGKTRISFDPEAAERETVVEEEAVDGDKAVKLDNGIVSDNEASSHYRSGDEPEPIDLTHLNIEASMMCLASKIRTICGRANSPTLSNRTFRFRELDSLKKQTFPSIQDDITHPFGIPRQIIQNKTDTTSRVNQEKTESQSKLPETNFQTQREEHQDVCIAQQADEVDLQADEVDQKAGEFDLQAAEVDLKAGEVDLQSGEVDLQASDAVLQAGEIDLEAGEHDMQQSGGFKIPDVPKPSNSEIQDWAGEVRPSMRKLRQGMDSLLKSSRLVCSVLRLQQVKDAVSLTHAVKYRRDVCFSQALTSLVSALMARLWCLSADPSFINLLVKLGPLVHFEGLLSHYGEDVTIINDMIVAVEDLRSVEFTLVLVERRSRSKSSGRKVGHVAGSGCTAQCATNCTAHMPLITCSVSSFPLPRVTGSRNSLKVLLPVPEWVYAHLHQLKNMTFSVTPVFFNVGINQNATIADKLNLNGPQLKNNADNFRILADYVRRFKKLGLFHSEAQDNRRTNWRSREHNVDDLMSILKNEVGSTRSKNVDVLSLAQQITNKLAGIRFTSCKSGKDRTGMSATLEQVNLLSREFDLADTEFQRALGTFRSEGLRRFNCEKNIGQPRYAFSSLQLSTFPKLYRPPVGTYGSTQT